MTDGCCAQCGAERVPLLRQRLPRQTAARRDLRGDRDHPPRRRNSTSSPSPMWPADTATTVLSAAAGTVQMPSALSAQLCVRVNSQWQGEWSHFARVEAVKG